MGYFSNDHTQKCILQVLRDHYNSSYSFTANAEFDFYSFQWSCGHIRTLATQNAGKGLIARSIGTVMSIEAFTIDCLLWLYVLIYSFCCPNCHLSFIQLATVSIVKLVFFHRQSYDVEISVDIPGSTSKSTNILDLKNPYFRYGGQVVAPPPQGSTTSPTEQYYQTNGYQTNTVNLKVNNNQSQEHQQVQNLANFTSVSISGGGLSRKRITCVFFCVMICF